ncbi:MAG: YybS family protein [Sneathiella sp.]|nr:YybS family protein [Sneathiella sp.]
MVKELVIAVALGILNILLLSVSIVGNTGGASYGTAFQTLAMWTLSLVPLFVSGLGFGVRSAVISVLSSALVASILLSPVFAATYAVISGVPVILLVRQALLWRETDGQRYWYPTEYLMIWWAGISVALTGVAMGLLHWDEALRQGLVDGFDQMLAQLTEMRGAAPALTGEEFVSLMPQFLGPMWGLFILLSGSLAQGLLVRFNRNIRPSPELTKMELPNWLALVFIGATALSVIVGGAWPVVGAIVITLETAFFLQGMAVIHVVTHRWNNRPLILGAVYVVIILTFFTLWLVLVITILGLLENWIGFRRRFAVTTKLEED